MHSTTDARKKTYTDLRDYAFDAIAIDDQIVDRLLENTQVRLIFDNVRIAAWYSTRSAWARVARTAGPCAVQDAELDAAAIGGQRHRAAECVDLLDQMAFADAADGRIARHLAERFDTVRQQQRFAAEPCRGQTGLGTGMTAADNDHAVVFRVFHGALSGRGRRIIYPAPVLYKNWSDGIVGFGRSLEACREIQIELSI